MHAVEIREPGPPDVLRVVERPLPAPQPGEVLIKVAAAGVNRPDCLQRRGLYPAPRGASDLPGLEVAGTVAMLGQNATGVQVGERVCALLAGGGYAEYCTAPAGQCLPVPESLSLRQAAAIPETFFTVWSNVFERARLQAGETLLVHGGASGIGTTAIQLGRALGARVLVTVGSAEKAALCLKLGAERAIDYNEEPFPDAVRAHTAGHGADVILDIVGGSYLEKNIETLAVEGRLAVIGVLGGGSGKLSLGKMLTRRLTVTASTLRARSAAEKARIGAALRERVWPLLEAGQVTPVIQAALPLGEAARAHEILEANQAMGKIVLVIDDTA